MSTTSRNKNLIFIIAALLLTNIAVLVYFLWIKEPAEKPRDNNRGGNGMTEMFQNEVGFTNEQIEQYKILKEEQRATIRPMFDGMRKAKDSLWRLMSDTTVSDSVLNRAADAIAQKQKALDLQTFKHFQRLRAICKPDQLAKYDTAILHLFSKMGKPAKRNEADKAKEKK
jgi:Spy/CpxP family protein refolding chaperone